ncbi:MAG: ABC transporter permease [Chloroflexi bacterium]|nr:ABC transporter permease [Chloroflexota bacterium]
MSAEAIQARILEADLLAGAEKNRLLSILGELWKKKVVFVGGVILFSLLFVGIFAPYVSPYDPLKQELNIRISPPIWMAGAKAGHILGTDALGRDILSRLIWGARISLTVAVGATALSIGIGASLGLLAGFSGRKVDDLIMRLVDIQLAFPFILLAIALVSVMGASLQNVVIVLGITTWATPCRLVRAEVLSIKEREYIVAARASGQRTWSILLGQILPNAATPILVLATFDLGRFILSEASLSYLGLGVPPPTPSWGSMVADGQDYLSTAWWVSTIPGFIIMFACLGGNLLGDFLRDVMDPELKE